MCLESRVGAVSFARWYFTGSNFFDAVGSGVSLALHGLFLTVPDALGVGYEREVAREGQTQIPILL